MTDTTKPDGGPAFPKPDHATHYTPDGMSLRDYFAAHAPQPPECWRSDHARRSGFSSEERCLAMWAYEYADAMLKERAR